MGRGASYLVVFLLATQFGLVGVGLIGRVGSGFFLQRLHTSQRSLAFDLPRAHTTHSLSQAFARCQPAGPRAPPTPPPKHSCPLTFFRRPEPRRELELRRRGVQHGVADAHAAPRPPLSSGGRGRARCAGHWRFPLDTKYIMSHAAVIDSGNGMAGCCRGMR